jgi:transcriptional regulator with XRE-family HTH domain
VDEFQPELRPEDTGARLRAVRELTGLSSRDVARAAGLTKREVAAVERGRRRLTVDELRAVSGALNVDPEMLAADGLGAADRATTESERIDAVAGHDPDQWGELPESPADLPPAIPLELPNSERRTDFMTRKRVEDSWADLRAEMEGVIRQCMRLSTIGSGDDPLEMLDSLEAEIRQLKTNRNFHREVGRHERTIAQARGGSRVSKLSGSRARSQ